MTTTKQIYEGFLYADLIALPWQLLIVLLADILGTLAAVKLELEYREPNVSLAH